MTASRHFSADYDSARAAFLEASRRAGCGIETLRHPLPGPAGQPLSCDIAWLGPEDAEAVLVTVSATHGVEGFCGSGVQVGWLAEGFHKELPPGLAFMQIHAINPHGFAWLRRVTEANVDLNRNFVDHDQPYPENPGYDQLAEAICPPEWDDATIAAAQAEFDAYAAKHGARALQSAVSSGQYRHPDGLFFGGHAIAWSNRVLLRILAKRLARARRVAVVDYHTGLGPRGYGERICCHRPGSAALARAEAWYGGDVTSPYLGSSASVELCGVNLDAMERALAETEVTAVALEYGTLPSPEVRLALRADNWLHARGDVASKKGRAIKAQIREAFYPDQDDWKQAVFERAVDTQRQAIAGLTGG